MTRPLSKLIFFLALFTALLSGGNGFAQACSFTSSVQRVCLGATVTFTPTFSGGTPTKYEWDFGDGKRDSVQKPSYKYNTPGVFQVNLKITFNGGATCNATPFGITVFPLPNADLTVESYPVQCFDGNYVCLKDRSTPTAAPIQKRTILWGDGGAIQNAPLTQKDFCQSYASVGVFTPVIEVTDTNGCIARKELKNVIKIAEDVYPMFTYSEKKVCGRNGVVLYNNYLTDKSAVKNWWWDFGDGSVFKNLLWDSIGHVYDSAGTFTAHLVYEAYSGCIDTFSATIHNASPLTFTFTTNVSPKTVCYNSRGTIHFSATEIPGADYAWIVYDENGGNPRAIGTRTGYMNPNFISTCGKFPYRLHIGLAGCDTFSTMDTLVILGPVTHLERKPFVISNKYQCSGDTIHAPPGNFHFSDYCSNSLAFLWDFGDPYAAKCTTFTRAGINVGMNCNFSRDSINVMHKYSDPVTDTCYRLRLTIKDTITGCETSDSTQIIIGKPSARNIYALKPHCLYWPIYFDIEDAKPACDKEYMWVLPDSACPNSIWEPLLPPYRWTYNFTCNSSGWVTVGFVVKNGNCYDTIWYHNMLFLKDFDGGILVKQDRTCDSITFHISFRDSLQQDMKLVTWDFENGLNVIVDTLDSVYTKLPSNSYTYKTPGVKTVLVGLLNDSGCFKYDAHIAAYGHFTDFSFDSIICAKDYVVFFDTVRYYHEQFVLEKIAHWRLPPPKKEWLYWDYGDGNLDTGAIGYHQYATAGLYTVKLISEDSFSCRNTVEKTIRVNESKADFGMSDTLFVCGQIARFYDSSFTKLMTPPGYPKLDSIKAWTWDFGDGKTPSHLKNPYHDYTSYGVFNVKLTVTNTNNCKDSIIKQIRVKGPKPSFEIDGDTIGCAPFTAKFKNISVDTKYWVWNYGDSSVYSTGTFENVQHTFIHPGIYDVWLYGVDSFTNPVTQNLYYCSGVYPDPLNPSQKRIRIYVLPVPQADFNFNQPVCIGQPVTFTDSSNAVYTHYRWNLPGGDSLVADFPQNSRTYVFNQAGSYQVFYTPSYQPPSGIPHCPDTISKTVQVMDVLADFEIDTIKSKKPVFYFTNTSVNSAVCQWDFGHPKSLANNTSANCNPFHDYTGDTGYFKVCLTVMSPEGCFDSVCKMVYNDFYPYLFIPNVFTPDNNDEFNDAFDIPIKGEDYYDLVIYNRWGEKVFMGDEDGEKNDGVNWNGHKFNTGEKCPSGTYYFIFEYHFPNDEKHTIKTGTVTLLRPEN